jgi:hypothetical protein
MKNGKMYRVGMPEPEKLDKFIKTRISLFGGLWIPSPLAPLPKWERRTGIFSSVLIIILIEPIFGSLNFIPVVQVLLDL